MFSTCHVGQQKDGEKHAQECRTGERAEELPGVRSSVTTHVMWLGRFSDFAGRSDFGTNILSNRKWLRRRVFPVFGWRTGQEPKKGKWGIWDAPRRND